MRKVRAVAVVMMAAAAGTAGGCQSPDPTAAGTTTTFVRPSAAEREAVLGELAEVEDAATTDETEACVAVGAAALWMLSPTTQWARTAPGADPVAWDEEEAALLADVPPDLLDEIEVFRAAGRDYTARVGRPTAEDLLDPEVQQRLADAREAIETPELLAASDAIEQHLLSCPHP